MNEQNPVKDFLFDYIEQSEQRFQELFSKTNMDEIIDDILKNCFDEISLMGNKDESLAILTTGVLHYMLTNSMISSQRKIEYRGVEIDIVIPDLKTLEKDPKKTLIITIPKTLDKKMITKNLKQLQKIQPEKQNIWMVLSQDLGIDKTYVVQKNDSTFSNIIYDIGKFVNLQGQNKFKILRI